MAVIDRARAAPRVVRRRQPAADGRECRQAEPMLGPAIARRPAGRRRRLGRSAAARPAPCCGRRQRRRAASHRPHRATRLLTLADRAAGAELADGTAITARQVVLARRLGLGLARRPARRSRSAAPAGQGPDHPAADHRRPPGQPGCRRPWSAARCAGSSAASRLPGAARQDGELVSARPRKNSARTPPSPRAASGSSCATPARSCPASPSWSWPSRSRAAPGHAGQRAGARPVRAARAGRSRPGTSAAASCSPRSRPS